MAIQILDLDCLLHIFEYLPLPDIIKLEETSPEIFQEAANSFYRTVKNYQCNMRYMDLPEMRMILPKIGPYLTSFSFSGGHIMDKEYKRTLIMTITEKFHSLTKLSLNFVPFEPDELRILAEIPENLEILDLGNCYISDGDLRIILSKQKNLKELTLNGNTLLTGKCLTELSYLEKLDVSYCYALDTKEVCYFLRKCKGLRYLKLTGSNRIDWKDIFVFLAEFHSQIEELYMMSLGVEHDQVPYESFTHLKVIEIQGKRFGT